MEIGDHLISPRTGYLHHGIYVGSNKVIHYGGYTKGKLDGIVVKTSLEEFTQGNRCKVVHHKFRRFGRERTAKRACSRLGERRYGLLFNNCESFVTWCIWGVHYSKQVGRALLGIVALTGLVLRALL